MQPVSGTHCILDLYDCPYDILDNEDFIIDAIKQAAEKSQTHILDLSSHRFDPQGVTAVALLTESHLSIHTWPESGYAAADIFSCGQRTNPQTACSFLATHLKAQNYRIKTLNRGPTKPE